jgi:ketosteroid isomerase-like protein
MVRFVALRKKMLQSALRTALRATSRYHASFPKEPKAAHAKLQWGSCREDAPWTVMEDKIPMRSATRHVLVVTCAVFLLGSLCSPREVPMRSESNAQSQEQATRKTIDSFNEAFNRHDADGLAKFLTEDTVFEDTSPAPDGRRVEGKAAVVEFWRGWFVRNADARFEAEEVIVSGSRATVLWSIARCATVSRGICAALTFLPYEMGK